MSRGSIRGSIAWASLTAVSLVLGLAACQRQVTLVNRGEDSTAVGLDSALILLREVPEAWDGSVDDNAAARLTARAVQRDFARRDPTEWPRRAKFLLDSLGVGVEIGGGPCGLLLNLFLRSDPARGSWPFLFWCADHPTIPQVPKIEPLEGRGLRLLAAHLLRSSASAPSESSDEIAALFGRSSGPRQEPILFVWKQSGDHWTLTQTLGPDSLGGYGEGRFQTEGPAPELVVRSYRPNPGFDECVSCPHVWYTHRFRWQDGGFVRVETRPEFSTYAALVRFIHALESRDVNPALFATGSAVVDLAHSFDWDLERGGWRVAPGSETSGLELMIFRGQRESYRVTFEPRGGDWLVSGIESVPRSIE